LRYLSPLGLQTISRLSASMASCRCSTSSRMIVTAVGLSSISMGTLAAHMSISPQMG
jgi:hypothetical protein